MTKIMNENEVPSFIKEIFEAGATLCAAGVDFYFFDDLRVPEPESAYIHARVNEICKKYGTRDHLRREIAGYLTILGHRIDIRPEPASPNSIHGSENAAVPGFGF